MSDGPAAVRICTAIMGNFLPHARVLARSFLEHNPEGNVSVLVVDHPGDADEPFEVLRPWELGLDDDEVGRVLTLFAPPLSAGALRAALMRHLLMRERAPVLFLDPDMQVFASLTDVARLAAAHHVILSPHLLDPPGEHERFPGDQNLLLAGAFNAGLVAAGLGGRGFLDWWAARLQRWTIIAPQAGYYATQRWLDLVPSMFPHHVISDPGCNVMTLNAHERHLSYRDGNWYARNSLLRIFHFGGGFDPTRPYLIAPGYAPAAVLFSQNPSLASLHREYADALLANGWSNRPQLPPPYEIEPAVPLDSTMSAAYRTALLASEESGSYPEPPNPYRHGAAAFAAWLRAPSDLRRNARGVSRYLQTYWQAHQLADRFPDIPGFDAARYLEWARSGEGVERGIPASFTQPPLPLTQEVDVASLGVNLVAREGGLSEYVARRIAAGLRSAGEPVVELVYPRTVGARTTVSADQAIPAVHDVTILCMPPGIVADFNYDIGVLFRAGRRVIVAVIDSLLDTAAIARAAEIADEVWCWDRRTAELIGKTCDIEATLLPFPTADPLAEEERDHLACWADLAEPGHAPALMDRIAAHLSNDPLSTERLHVHISAWEADPLTAETSWGMAHIHNSLEVHRAAAWPDALPGTRALLPLGQAIGPLEAEAIAAGVDVLSPGRSQAMVGRTPAFADRARVRLASARAALRRGA